MKRLHILGRKNHGKTTLLVEIVQYLTAQGLRVGTIKHTHHAHELDVPGKDSHRHRSAGARAAGILSRGMNAVYWSPAQGLGDGRYDDFAPHFADCDLVLVEGDTQTAAVKIEVWRQSVGGAPLAKEDPSIAAVVTDDAPGLDASVWPRRDVPAVAAGILRLMDVAIPAR